jgi:hypothetical protein
MAKDGSTRWRLGGSDGAAPPPCFIASRQIRLTTRAKMGPPRGRGKGRPAGSSGRGGKTNTPRVQRDRSHYAGPGFSEIPASAVDQARGQGSDEDGSDGKNTVKEMG